MLILAVTVSTAQGLLLTKNTNSSCLGEEIVFTCTVTEGPSLSWHFRVTRDTNIAALTYTFLHHYYGTVQSRKTWSQPGFHVELNLLSIESVLVSTLSANLTSIIIDAEVTCQQYSPVVQAQSGYFSLASNNYSCIAFNVTVTIVTCSNAHYFFQVCRQSQFKYLVSNISMDA